MMARYPRVLYVGIELVPGRYTWPERDRLMRMKIPESELYTAQRKCTILAEIKEDYQHVIRALEAKYGVAVRVQTVRPVIGGAVGSEKILLSEMENYDYLRSRTQ